MGCVKTIDADHFPKQSDYVNRRVKVCFHYDTSRWIGGWLVRDDREEPYRTILLLDNGRFVDALECQYCMDG